MITHFKITKPFKVLAEVNELFCRGKYEGNDKVGEVIELRLAIEGGYSEEVKEFLKKVDVLGQKQTVTITVVP